MSYVSILRDSAIGMTDDVIKEYGGYVTDDKQQQLIDIEHDMQHVVTKSQHDELMRKFDATVDDIADRKDDDERKKEEQNDNDDGQTRMTVIRIEDEQGETISDTDSAGRQ